MDTVTYPHPSVVEALSRDFVPVRLESARNGELARRVNVRWLPGLAVLSPDERPAHVMIGFLPPSDLCTELLFGRAMVAMADKRYHEAHALFERVAAVAEAERAPEALFWWGVSRIRLLKDFHAAIAEPWGRIVERWPRSQWARKVGYALGRPPALD